MSACRSLRSTLEKVGFSTYLKINMGVLGAIVIAGSFLAGALGQTAPSPSAFLTKVNLNPARIRYLADTDYQVWTIPAANAASGRFNGIDFTLTAGGGSDFYGNYYKFAYTRFLSGLGERVVDQGVTTEDQAGFVRHSDAQGTVAW